MSKSVQVLPKENGPIGRNRDRKLSKNRLAGESPQIGLCMAGSHLRT